MVATFNEALHLHGPVQLHWILLQKAWDLPGFDSPAGCLLPFAVINPECKTRNHGCDEGPNTARIPGAREIVQMPGLLCPK